MRLMFAIFIGCLGIFISSCSTAGGNCSNSSSSSCGTYKNMCAGESFCAGYGSCVGAETCECSDPACRQKNDCLSASRCCRAFGNPGAT